MDDPSKAAPRPCRYPCEMPAVLDPLAHFRLDGRVVVLTGASSGLGERFARVLDSLGATTVMAARRKDRLDALADELTHAEAVACDVSMDGANETLIDDVVPFFRRSRPRPTAVDAVDDGRAWPVISYVVDRYHRYRHCWAGSRPLLAFAA